MSWKNLDTDELLARRDRQHEATMSGNVGAYAVPVGTPLRAPVVAPVDLARGALPTAGPGATQGYQSLDDVLDAYSQALGPSKR